MRKIYLAFFASTLFISAFAQKSTDQKGNLAPGGIRIDGRITEWSGLPFTENKRTSLDYVLANDEKNLYLVIKSKEQASISKIMLGGISFIINTEGRKKDKDAFSITYPLVKRAGRGAQGFGANRGGFGGQNRSEQTTAQRDSIALALHKTQLETVKEIKVLGFKAIQDTLISIYNEYSIKTVAAFDDAGVYTYELSVPLAQLGLKSSDAKEIAFQIKLNGLTAGSFGGRNGGGNGGGGGRNGGGFGGGGNRGGGGARTGGGSTNFQDLMLPTDFWDKYTLAKK